MLQLPRRHFRSLALLTLGTFFLVLVVGCSSEQAANQPQDVQAQRTRDSTIAESNLPGAAGVRGALKAADEAAARKAQIDSIGQSP